MKIAEISYTNLHVFYTHNSMVNDQWLVVNYKLMN